MTPGLPITIFIEFDGMLLLHLNQLDSYLQTLKILALNFLRHWESGDQKDLFIKVQQEYYSKLVTIRRT